MMRGLAVALLSASTGLFVGVVNASCIGNMLVDDFSNFGSNLNSLGQWASGQYFISTSRIAKGILCLYLQMIQ